MEHNFWFNSILHKIWGNIKILFHLKSPDFVKAFFNYIETFIFLQV